MTEPLRVAVTGATGFVGRRASEVLLERGLRVRALLRSASTNQTLPAAVERSTLGSLGAGSLDAGALEGVDVLVHLAARAHVMRDESPDPLSEYRRTNVVGTGALLDAARRAGVRRVVFLSSIKVLGEESRRPYRDDDPAAPADPYGQSKAEAEAVVRSSPLEWVILRAPLVYGPGVRANFRRLLRLAWRGCSLPLPFGGIANQRSLLSLDNLASALELAMIHPAAARSTFNLSDGEDLSTSELLRRLILAFGGHPRLLRVPLPVLEAMAQFAGQQLALRRLVGSLQVDGRGIREQLGWVPPQTVDAALAGTVQWYRGHER